MTAPTPLTIDVVSDVVCPWCYIGKRHLEAAIAHLAEQSPQVAVRVVWHPFQLNPELPTEGADRRQYLEQKFGGPERAAQIYARVIAAGRNAGLAFDFDRIERQPNTRAAHALIEHAQRSADAAAAEAVVERLFRAYFIDGRYVGNVDTLVAIATECGLDGDAARAAITDPARLEAVAAQDADARRQGISGVPFLIFNQRLALSGAQPPEVMLDALRQSLAAAPPSP